MIDRYTTPEMRELWADQRRFELWLELECLLVESFERAGEAPEGTAWAIRDAVRIDPARISEIEETTHHDVIAFLTHVEEQAGDPTRFLHLGLTSSDVVDTCFSVMLSDALGLVAAELDVLRAITARRARELAKTPRIGRTHGMHAEPMTMGLLFASWKANFDRDAERLARAREGIAYGKLSGAVGTYAHLDPAHEEAVLTELGLRVEPVATQVVPRDRHAEVFCTLARIAASVERVAVELRHLQRTEVGEASEPFRKGQKGSSAMPHKKNPIRSENVTGLARLVRGHALSAMENVALWHERDISHSSVERVIGPDATTAVHFMLRRLGRVLDGLVIHADRMMENLARTRGFPFSQAVLLALIDKGLVRQRAYEMVQAVAMRCYGDGEELHGALAKDEDVMARLSSEELARCFDLDHALRRVPVILDRVVPEGGEV